MGASNWSDADTETLKSLWKDRLSGTQISMALSGRFSRCAVIGKAGRLGLEARPSTINRHLGGKKVKAVPQPKPVIHKPEELSPCGPIGDFPAPGLCRYPMNADGEDFQCCGREVKPHRPYCPRHCETSYTPAKK